jgi:hypothetical protein
MPAICPPLRPPPLLLSSSDADEVAVLLAVPDDVDEDVGNKLGMDEKTGRSTFSHRPVAFEVRQHESVPFSGLPRQKSHRPARFC